VLGVFSLSKMNLIPSNESICSLINDIVSYFFARKQKNMIAERRDLVLNGQEDFRSGFGWDCSGSVVRVDRRIAID
jgi:hypothetical protein